jgi:hypothetical protein
VVYRKSLKSAGGQNQPEMIMSTLALWSADSASSAIATKPRPGLFERLIKARERQATRHVYSYLNLQSDERLKDLGYTSEEIAALRAGEVRIPR